jgi:signal transduction histidine kinase/CheY-like chemotaxis protein
MSDRPPPLSRPHPLGPGERLERFEAFARALSNAVTTEEVAAAIAEAACTTLGARGAMVAVTSDEATIRVVGEHGIPAEASRQGTTIPLGCQVPLCRAIRTGRAEWIPDVAEHEREHGDRDTRQVPAAFRQSIAAVPIVLEGRAVGGLVLGFDVRGTPPEADRAFLQTLIDIAGQAIERARRVEAEKRARIAAERLALVLDAADAMAGATSSTTVLARLTQLCVPRLADGCAVELVDENGQLVLAAVMHVDPEKIETARRLRERFPVDMSAPRGAAAVLRTGVSELFSEIDDALLRSLARGEEHLEILRELDMRSVMIVPLEARHEVIGTMSLFSTRPDVRYDATDLRLAEKLASRAALALENAKLMDELRARAVTEHEAGATAQRAAARLSVLAEVSNALAEAKLDPRAVSAALARAVASRLGDGCVVLRIDETEVFEVTAVEHADPQRRATMVELLGSTRQRVDEGLSGRVVATGKPVLVRDLSAATDGPRVVSGYAQHLESFGVRSLVVVPIRIDTTTVGTVVALRESGPAYEEADVALLQDLADRAAAALSNAQLHVAEQHARRLVERQQAITSKLGAALTTDAMIELIVEELARELHADSAAYFELAGGGRTLRMRATRNVPTTRRERFSEIPVDASGALGAAVRERRPIFVGSPEELAKRFSHVARHDDIDDVRSFACIPLTLGDSVIHGVVTLASTREHGFADVDRAFASNIAEQCAHALERARLLAAERAAKAEAEAASRLKDEFLATVSHELRTPLNAILGWASLLRAGRLDEKSTSRAIETIERNARAQARLVEDVLDVSRIISGKLAIKSDLVDVGAVLAQALDVVRPSALAKDIAIEIDIVPALPRVRGDADRLQQVYWNVLSNAVKFTPRGGRVVVRASARKDCVAVEVTDTGQGIRRDFFPFLFEPFRQADGTTTRAHGGLGLGLSIARRVVDLHGGEIRAASEGDGRGATFTVELPAATLAAATTTGGTGRRARVSSRLEGADVLCVDDDADARELAAAILEGEGARVRTASSAREAMKEIEARAPDVLLCDLGMPEEDGLSFLPRARLAAAALGRAFPALAFTAYADAEHVSLIAKAGFDGHLTKPVDSEALVLAVARARSR